MQRTPPFRRDDTWPAGRNPPVVLGVDPGLRITGYALVTQGARADGARLLEAGAVRMSPRVSLERRLMDLESGLSEVLEQHRPHVLACEQLYAHYQHPRTAIRIAHARGVILALAARRGMRLVHPSATHVKKLLTGSGRAGKRQVQRAVAATLGLPRLPEPHDVADAIAIALAGLRMDAAQRCLAERAVRVTP